MGENGRLERVILGGLDQLESFTGDERDYTYVATIKVGAPSFGQTSKLVVSGLRNGGFDYTVEKEYEGTNSKQFMTKVDEYMKAQDWFFTFAERSTTWFHGRQQMSGDLYSRNTNPHSDPEPETAEKPKGGFS